MPRSTATLEQVEPRHNTHEQLIEHHVTSKDHDLSLEPTTLEHEGDRIDATFQCEHCRAQITEQYLLRYVERVEDGKRWHRHETPTCKCEPAHAPHRDGDAFREVKREKRDTDTAVAVGACEYCNRQYDDVHKYQRSRSQLK